MSKNSSSHSWWQTAPGILTAFAALLTALTGMLVAVHQVGLLDRPVGAASETRPRHGDQVAIPPTSELEARAAVRMAMETLTLGQLQYRFLSSRIEARTPETVTLVLNVRLTNNGGAAVNFWNDSFRMQVDGVPRAPTSNLSKVVYSLSAEEGVVEFVIPRDATALALQVRHHDEIATIPIEW
jgi:hypothetical protein